MFTPGLTSEARNQPDQPYKERPKRMDRGPLLEILNDMKGTTKELDLAVVGEEEPIELRNVVEAEPLLSASGIKITTMQNHIWLDASHVSAAWQARTDL